MQDKDYDFMNYPRFKVKPIFNDKTCWKLLQEKSRET